MRRKANESDRRKLIRLEISVILREIKSLRVESVVQRTSLIKIEQSTTVHTDLPELASELEKGVV